MKHFVSVVVPTLNEENYIEKCLNSVKSQDYNGKYEIIVVDSNSKDRTVPLARKYTKRVIVTKERGVSVGRNIGAKAAKGDIILFLDGDTILMPSVISEVIKLFDSKKLIGISVPLLCDNFEKNILYLLSIYGFLFLKKFRIEPIYAVCFACRRESFFQAGGFRNELRVAEDIEFGERLKKFGRLEVLRNAFAITSSRRLEKWGVVKQLKAWPGGYLAIKLFGKQPEYPPVRK